MYPLYSYKKRHYIMGVLHILTIYIDQLQTI